VLCFQHSRFAENYLNMILGDEHLLSQGGSVTVSYQSKIQGQTHMKASKNHNNVVGEEQLAYIGL
jgi:hypothetical protein